MTHVKVLVVWRGLSFCMYSHMHGRTCIWYLRLHKYILCAPRSCCLHVRFVVHMGSTIYVFIVPQYFVLLCVTSLFFPPILFIRCMNANKSKRMLRLHIQNVHFGNFNYPLNLCIFTWIFNSLSLFLSLSLSLSLDIPKITAIMQDTWLCSLTC